MPCWQPKNDSTLLIKRVTQICCFDRDLFLRASKQRMSSCFAARHFIFVARVASASCSTRVLNWEYTRVHKGVHDENIMSEGVPTSCWHYSLVANKLRIYETYVTTVYSMGENNCLKILLLSAETALGIEVKICSLIEGHDEVLLLEWSWKMFPGCLAASASKREVVQTLYRPQHWSHHFQLNSPHYSSSHRPSSSLHTSVEQRLLYSQDKQFIMKNL